MDWLEKICLLYFNSTFAPAASSFFLISSASDADTSDLTVFGAASTRSLASFKPRLVIARTSLITLILLSPKAVRTTSNLSLTSTTAATAGAAEANAAADTPHFSSSFLLNSASSRIVRDDRDSDSCSRLVDLSTLVEVS